MKIIMTDLIVSQLSSISFLMLIEFDFNISDDFTIDVENKNWRIKQKKTRTIIKKKRKIQWRKKCRREVVEVEIQNNSLFELYKKCKNDHSSF